MMRKSLTAAVLTVLTVATPLAFAAPAAAAAPDAPAKPTVEHGDGQVTVTFSAPPDGGSTITGYTAECASSDGGATGSDTGADSPIVVDALDNGRTYTCTVVATNVDGDSGPSEASDPVIPSAVPDAPAQPTVAHGDGQITVTFTEPADNGSAITAYDVDCESSDGGTAGTNTGTASPIVVTGLDNGKTYTCTVAASNINGAGAASPASDAVVPRTVPGTPAKPTVTRGNAQITVSFTPPASGGSTITGYTATCTSSNGGTTRTGTGATSPIVVSNLNNGKTYTCRVRATNNEGPGLNSPASDTTVPSRKPDQPARPTAKAGEARVKVSFTTPGNGGATITHYNVKCTSTNGGVAGSALGTASPVTVTHLSNAKSYTCTVAARNKNGWSPTSPASTAVIPRAIARGYRLLSGDGGVYTFGNARYLGSVSGRSFTTVIGMASTPSGNGYWLVNMAGQVFAFGDAPHRGQPSRLNKPIVGISATPSGRGYWLVATDGGIFAYGDARFYGSTGAIRLRRPIVGMAPTPDARGYWLVASDGGVFTFGNGRFFGSAARIANQRIVGIAPTATGRGYWLAGARGGVYSFGDAPLLGGAATNLRYEIRGIAATPSGRGYWLAAGDGGVFARGDAPFYRWKPTRLKQTIRSVSR